MSENNLPAWKELLIGRSFGGPSGVFFGTGRMFFGLRQNPGFFATTVWFGLRWMRKTDCSAHWFSRLNRISKVIIGLALRRASPATGPRARNPSPHNYT